MIEATVDTLRHALIEEIMLVTLAHVIFLMHFRSILIVTLPLPLAVLCSFLLMHYAHVTSNIMSLAGIAIAIGVLVDAGIVVTENAFRHLEGVDTHDRGRVFETVLRATKLVGRPTFFSMAIIILAFVPVFALTGQEGKALSPTGVCQDLCDGERNRHCADAGADSLHTAAPGQVPFGRPEPRHAVLCSGSIVPRLSWALDHRAITLSLAARAFSWAQWCWLPASAASSCRRSTKATSCSCPSRMPSISLAENTEYAKRQDEVLEKFPEVAYVAAKVARAETSTDPAGLNMTETIVHLKPRDQWRPGMTLPKLKSEMDRAVSLPGVANIWTQPIINRIDMLTTGIRSEIGVKVFGSDLTRARREGARNRRRCAHGDRRERRLSRAGHRWSVPRHPDRTAKPRRATASTSVRFRTSSKPQSAKTT